MTNVDLKGKEKLGPLNLLILALSIYVLVVLFISTVFKLPPEISDLLDMIDNGICMVFLYDFCIRFYRAESKLQFMKWGWIDLISSIPTIDFFRAGRALRLFRLLRILRAYRSTKHLVSHIFKSRSQGAFSTVLIVAVLMLIFSAIAILQVETDPNSNIKNAEDALWWAVVTITTVGYGDRYPVTTEGRLIAMALMIVGVGLFGTISGFVASWFVGGAKKEEEEEEARLEKERIEEELKA